MNERGTGPEPRLNLNLPAVPGVTRRTFLLGAASVAALSACGGSGGGDGGSTTTAGGGGTATTATAVAAPSAAGLDADPFTLGVASGDPLPDSVILWTRLAPDPLARDGVVGIDGQRRPGEGAGVDDLTGP